MKYKTFKEFQINEQMPENKGWIRKKLIDFFTNTKDMNDDKVHELADKLKISPHDLETQIYSILVDFFQYGKYNQAIKEREVHINQEELEVGIRFEMEHTVDTNIARRIALDHLCDCSNYYTLLQKMETECGKNTEGEDEINK